MTLSLIVAVSENGVIGRANRLPWRLPEDLQRFRRLTTGHPVIMGRKTFESIGKPLPGRTSIVVSRTERFPGTITARSLDEALEEAARAPGADATFVIGGGEVYREALPLAARIHLTRVHARVDGDATFPELGKEWVEVGREPCATCSPPATFLILERGG